MRAVRCLEPGPLDQLVLAEIDDPIPRPGQVLVEVVAAGVNYVDALFAQGRYQLKPPPPFTAGSEVAGRVIGHGDGVDAPALGTEVLVSCGLGGFAELLVAPATSAVPIPAGLDLVTAAAFCQSYSTMAYTYRRRVHLEAGERVLVLGAGGGIGLAAIDLAVAAGAEVLSVTSTEAKAEAAKAAGASVQLSADPMTLKEAVRATAEGGVDVVIDPVGGPLSNAALRCLREGGRHAVLGFASGEIPRLEANQVLLRNRSVVGVDWGAWALGHGAEQHALLSTLLGEVAAGQLHPAAPSTYPLDQAAQALADLEGRRVVGKVVLTTGR